MKKLFTLIEIIAIIVIMSILLAIAMLNLSDKKKDAIVAMMESNIKNIQNAVDAYRLEHNGQFPTAIEPTLEKPQKIDFDRLYPKYIKNLPNESKLPNQKYWIDVYGKVWGSTVNPPNSFYEGKDTIEWVSDNEVTSFRYYEIKSHTYSSTANKVNVSFIKEIINQGKKRIQIPKSNTQFLVSSIDEYGFETAPVGPSYQGVAEDWFTPLIQKDGEFFIEFGGKETMYWDRFWVLEDKPEGTSIEYFFSVQDEQGNWLPYITDFYKLDPSKRIRVKINMKANGDKKPSLLDMRIDFHFKGEQIEYFIPRLVSPSEVPFSVPESSRVFVFHTPNSGFIQNINPPYQYDQFIVYYYNPATGSFVNASSLGEIPPNTTIYIVEINSGTSGTYNPPIITVDSKPIPLQQEKPKEKPLPPTIPVKDIPELQDINWTTIDAFNLFFFAGPFEAVDWVSATIQDKQPEGTRILYYYTPLTEDSKWGHPYTSIESVPNSRALKVSVILQVETKKLEKVSNPEFLSMVINHAGGSLQPYNTNVYGNAFLAIYPKKLNDFDKKGYYPTTLIEWNYLFEDDRGSKVVDVEWRGDKRNQYEEPGEYTVEMRVKTDEGKWSQWVSSKIKIQKDNFGNGSLGDVTMPPKSQTIVHYNTTASISSINGNEIVLNNIRASSLAGNFNVGDEVMLYISKTNDRNIVGIYKFYRITEKNQNTIKVDKTIDSVFSPATTQVIKVMEFKSLTIENGNILSPNPYDGNNGGVIAIRVQDTLTLKGSISAYNSGYRYNDLNPNINGGHASGTSRDPRACDASGGGGGANQFSGGDGGYSTYSGGDINGKGNKNPFGNLIDGINRLTFGGAGGNSSYRNYDPCPKYIYGSNGGGVIYIAASHIDFKGGKIDADGGTSWTSGRGAGGSIFIDAKSITGIQNFSLSSTGGRFTNYNGTLLRSGYNNAYGGGGSGGDSYYSGGTNGYDATSSGGGNGGNGYLGGGGGGGNGYIFINSDIKDFISSYTFYPHIKYYDK